MNEKSRDMQEYDLEVLHQRHGWDRGTQSRPSYYGRSAAGSASIDRVDGAALGLNAHEWIIDRHDENAVYVLQLWVVDVAGHMVC